MHLTAKTLSEIEKIKRLNIVNSISGIKSANLIGTQSDSDGNNLAVFSSVIHLGTNPPLMGFILRPEKEVRRHTFENILEQKHYTINSVPTGMVHQAHYTSVKFEKDISEFIECGFGEYRIEGFNAPFVKESPIKIGLTFKEAIPISLNHTSLIIGQIEHLIIEDSFISEEGLIDLEAIGIAGIGGLNSYYALSKLNDFPYARKQNLPSFKKV